METVVQRPTDTFVVPIRGAKRKANLDPLANGKRARLQEYSVESDANSDTSQDEGSVVSSGGENITILSSRTQTPSTPLSSKASPRFPSDLKNHACTYDGCEKVFNRPAKLTQHIRSHNNDRPYVCPHLPCTKDFLRDTHLKHHIKSAHSDVRDYICSWEGCRKSFITNTRLKRHYAAHEGRQKFMCTECAQSFRKHGTLQAHITTVHEGKKLFSCSLQDEQGEVCGEGFNTVGKLKIHEGRVHGGKRFHCALCTSQQPPETPEKDGLREELGFSTYTALQQHIKTEHPPTCVECGLQCTTQATLKSHVEIQHGILGVDERRNHVCSEAGCGRSFTKTGNLNAHWRLVHGNTLFVCGKVDLSNAKNLGDWNGVNACGQALSTKANLVEHIRTIHLGLNHSRKGKNKSKVDSGGGTSFRQMEIPTITRLTGSGYGDEIGRTIPCLFSDCYFRFTREYDLEIHLEASHGLPYHEVQDLILERKVLADAQIWDKPPIHSTTEDLEAEDALDAQFDAEFELRNVDMALQDEEQEGEFWVGGGIQRATNSTDDWLYDEVEMHRLTNGDYDKQPGENGGTGDIDMLDPALL